MQHVYVSNDILLCFSPYVVFLFIFRSILFLHKNSVKAVGTSPIFDMIIAIQYILQYRSYTRIVTRRQYSFSRMARTAAILSPKFLLSKLNLCETYQSVLLRTTHNHRSAVTCHDCILENFYGTQFTFSEIVAEKISGHRLPVKRLNS